MHFLNPFSWLTQGTLLTTSLFTMLRGQLVGRDVAGNRYYRKAVVKGAREKRWVVYKGIPEPSKVPPEWHGWLHYTLDTLPDARGLKKHVWQKQGQPNLSGTAKAYLPEGHLKKSGVHAPTAAAYTAWNPS